MLEMVESGIAKMVDSGDERKRSGEIWRRVAMTLKPWDLRALEAFNERPRLMNCSDGVGLSLGSSWITVEIATSARATDIAM